MLLKVTYHCFHIMSQAADTLEKKMSQIKVIGNCLFLNNIINNCQFNPQSNQKLQMMHPNPLNKENPRSRPKSSPPSDLLNKENIKFT